MRNMAVRILLLQPSQLQTHRPPALLAETAVVATAVAVAENAVAAAKRGSNSNLSICFRGVRIARTPLIFFVFRGPCDEKS